MKNGQIPLIVVEALTLPEAWEKMVLAVWGSGIWIETQYDGSGEKPSLDATGIVKVLNPISEPRIHKNIPLGYNDLVYYGEDLCKGINLDHVEKGFYSYTYPWLLHKGFECNQLDKCLDLLEACSFSRRIQMTTWNPKTDLNRDDPPCLQRIWLRMIKNDAGQFVLNMNTYWRSRDLWKAWFINAFGMVYLQSYLCSQLSDRLHVSVVPGRYIDSSDSLHIYGRDQDRDEIEKMLTSSYLSRSISSKDPIFLEMKQVALDRIEKERIEREAEAAKAAIEAETEIEAIAETMKVEEGKKQKRAERKTRTAKTKKGE